jgi:hypothetical protein
MRFSISAASSGAFLCILGASTAMADQCPQTDGSIDTDRPDVTNSSVVLPQGSFQNENGLDFGQRNSSREFDVTNSRLRWGIAPCLEFLVDIPTYSAPISGSLSSGFTDVTPAIKWQIGPSPGKLDLSATLGVGLPTGTKAVVGSGVQPYVQFPWSAHLGGGWLINGILTNFITPANTANKCRQKRPSHLSANLATAPFSLSNMLATTTSMVDPAISSIPVAAIGSHRRSRSISISVLGSTTTHRPIFSGLATQSGSTVFFDEPGACRANILPMRLAFRGGPFTCSRRVARPVLLASARAMAKHAKPHVRLKYHVATAFPSKSGQNRNPSTRPEDRSGGR